METVFGVDIPLLLLLLPLVILLLCWRAVRWYNFWSSRGIPGPKPQLFFGNQWQMHKQGMQNSVREWSKLYGRVYGIFMNTQPMLVTNDLDIISSVMVKDFAYFTDRCDQFTDRIFSKTVFFARGRDWRRIRKIITPSFTSGKLRYCGTFTMNVIMGTVFGIQVNSQKDCQNQFVTNAEIFLEGGGVHKTIFQQLLTLTPFLNHLAVYLQNPKKNPLNFLLSAIGRIVADRKEETVPRKQTDFLQLLVNAETSEDFVDTAENEKCLTHDEIIAQMMIFSLAGYETQLRLCSS
ncbi:cytochrome P450 3A6-like isoform X2 [Pomacea canaliculata]|uniref:cytochrome P450 3A6-like isoform X2 n=1 Tax=Pomacea canaliculata TaxID=400727 RepID=UPI000D73F523|nr:cytochrome P450 3A6-like isoform X2 [Pomacea canaliculata]